MRWVVWESALAAGGDVILLNGGARPARAGKQRRRGFVVENLRDVGMGERLFRRLERRGNAVDLHAEIRGIAHGHAHLAEVRDLLLGLVDFRSDKFEALARLLVVFQPLADGRDPFADRGRKAGFRDARPALSRSCAARSCSSADLQFGFDRDRLGGAEETFETGALMEQLQEQPEHAVERFAAKIIDARRRLPSRPCAGGDPATPSTADGGGSNRLTSAGLRNDMSC